MKKLQQTAILLLFILVAVSATAQTRGQGRISGKTVDETGQPLADVQVKATLAGQDQAVEGKSNNKGEFALNGVASGQWSVEFSKDGFETQKGNLTVAEDGHSPSVTVKMPKHVVDPAVELNAKAQEGMTLMQNQKFAEARAIFEGLLAKYPDVYQLNAYIAQAYAGENNLDKAVEYMKIASDKDPTNAEMRLVLADLMLEKGDKAPAIEMMKGIDLTKIKNPLPLINASISLINEKKTDEALDLLNKVAAQFPNEAQTYYYRGRAYIAAEKYPEAKADLEKFVSMAAPDARELPDAKKILDQIKDAK
jgi:Tfp pilus assembly protein PilF